MRNAVSNTLTQAMIFSLTKSKCFDIITTAQNKTEIMFHAHFSSSSKIFMLNMKDFEYSFLIKDDASLMHHKIKRVIYKMIFDKTSRHMKYMNKVMCRLIDDALK